VQQHGYDEHTCGYQPGDHPVGERSAGAGHLGAAGVTGEDRLVVLQRPATRQVAVPDRGPVPVQVVDHAGAAQVRLRDPQSTCRVRLDQRHRATANKVVALTRSAVGVGHGRVAAGLTQLDYPTAVGQLGREMHREVLARDVD
jgi:hypothetical protein